MKKQVSVYVGNTVKRKGVHAKTKSSKNKRSKLYKKRNVGQGR
jgi:hypothetical protein